MNAMTSFYSSLWTSFYNVTTSRGSIWTVFMTSFLWYYCQMSFVHKIPTERLWFQDGWKPSVRGYRGLDEWYLFCTRGFVSRRYSIYLFNSWGRGVSPFVGILILLFWITGENYPRFESHGRSFTFVILFLCAMDSSDLSLVQHLRAS